MNVPALTLAAPRAKDVLHAIQLAPRPRGLTRRLGSVSWSWFGAGLLLGASLVLLLGPTVRAHVAHVAHEGDDAEGPRGAA